MGRVRGKGAMGRVHGASPWGRSLGRSVGRVLGSDPCGVFLGWGWTPWGGAQGRGHGLSPRNGTLGRAPLDASPRSAYPGALHVSPRERNPRPSATRAPLDASPRERKPRPRGHWASPRERSPADRALLLQSTREPAARVLIIPPFVAASAPASPPPGSSIALEIGVQKRAKTLRFHSPKGPFCE